VATARSGSVVRRPRADTITRMDGQRDLFAYGVLMKQDFQYFLSGGDGPWGSLDWTYDRIGNRITETRDGVTDTYDYVPNGGGGHTATLLDQITLGLGGTRNYEFGDAGHLELVTAGANQVVFHSDDEGRLDALSRPVASQAVDILYDGRSFMQSTVDPASGAITEPTYSSEGLLHALRRQETPTSPEPYPYSRSNPDPATNSFAKKGHTICHARCYSVCYLQKWGQDPVLGRPLG
jgi:hypothetical protein